jgi:hypothetical protein
MQYGLVRRQPGDIEFGIIYGAIALFALFAARFLPVLSLAPACAFKALTGLPCPTCGSTRSVVHLADGDLLSAFSMNPLTVSVILFVVLAFVYGTVTLVFGLPRISFNLAEHEKKRLRIFCVLAVLADWAYLLTMLQ